MKRRTVTIVESTKAFARREDAKVNNNVLKNVRILGFLSRNNRIYPREVIVKNIDKYEGAVVNIDHPVMEGARKYVDRFGRIKNVRMEQDGLFGDLVFNPEHPLAPSFKWWAENDPSAIGLSHNITAKTRYDGKGFETITDIDKVVAVEVVSDPGTTNGLFEHYNNNLENKMSKKKEDLVRKLDAGKQIKMEDEDKDKEDKKKDDDKEVKKEGDMDFFEDDQPGDSGNSPENSPKSIDSLAEYISHLKERFMEVIGDEEKAHKCIEMLDLQDDKKESVTKNIPYPSEKKFILKEADDEDEDEKKDEEPKKAEEALRSSNKPGYRALMEELDSYRVLAKKNDLTGKAKQLCEKVGLPPFAITECFVDTLLNSKEDSWKSLVEDRKRVVFHTKKPISTGIVENKLSIESLVKQLTQE